VRRQAVAADRRRTAQVRGPSETVPAGRARCAGWPASPSTSPMTRPPGVEAGWKRPTWLDAWWRRRPGPEHGPDDVPGAPAARLPPDGAPWASALVSERGAAVRPTRAGERVLESIAGLAAGDSRCSGGPPACGGRAIRAGGAAGRVFKPAALIRRGPPPLPARRGRPDCLFWTSRSRRPGSAGRRGTAAHARTRPWLVRGGGRRPELRPGSRRS